MLPVNNTFINRYKPTQEEKEPHFADNNVRAPVVRQPSHYWPDLEHAYQSFLINKERLNTYLAPIWSSTNPHIAAQVAGQVRRSAITYHERCEQRNVAPLFSVEDVNKFLFNFGKSIGMENQGEFAPLPIQAQIQAQIQTSDHTPIQPHAQAGEATQIQPQFPFPSTPISHNLAAVPPAPSALPQATPERRSVNDKRKAPAADQLSEQLETRVNVTDEIVTKKRKTTQRPPSNSVPAQASINTKPSELDESACNFLRNLHEYGDDIFEHLAKLLDTKPRGKLTKQQLKGFITGGVAALLFLDRPCDELLRDEFATKFFIACAKTAFILTSHEYKHLNGTLITMLVNDAMPKELPGILNFARLNIGNAVSDYALSCLDNRDVVTSALQARKGRKYASYKAYLAQTVPATFCNLFPDADGADSALT